MKKIKVFSGIQPSGNLHIGNYLGAIVTWVREQNEKENIFCIVDEHAITVPQNPRDLKKRILELAKLYISAGIDPQISAIFVQSSRPEHAELGWILNNFTYFGELNRMTQFKDKSVHKGQNVTVGLFDYPVLMAADILLYNTNQVPVGGDQKQHIEMARTIANRMNKKFGNIFTIPEYYTIKESTRIMSLTDPDKKMSKSDPNPNSRIEILDNPDVIRRKIAKATTDSENIVKYDKKNKPGVSNLLNILASCKDKKVVEIENKYKNSSYSVLKSAVADAVIELLDPLQKRYDKISDSEVIEILRNGAEKVAPEARATLKRVKKVIGLGL